MTDAMSGRRWADGEWYEVDADDASGRRWADGELGEIDAAEPVPGQDSRSTCTGEKP